LTTNGHLTIVELVYAPDSIVAIYVVPTVDSTIAAKSVVIDNVN